MTSMKIQATRNVRLGLRALQFLFSLIALATIAAGFKTVTGSIVNEDRDFVEITSSAGSPATTFSMLMTYTSMLYALWFFVAVEFYAYAARPTAFVDRIVDSSFALVLLITGIVLATSDYVTHCSLLEDWIARYSSSSTPSFRCGSLKTGVVFTFFAMAAFLASSALHFVGASTADDSVLGTLALERGESFGAESEYHASGASHEDLLSPIGSSKAPETQV
ncbi:hypothetical protein PybrP1_007044 [[Pythium] brassicae (nom. inval.)]|nr:hypothetical protein PybrP1_007044 [[Pythium] brassicae (nom. inval.)]